MAVSSQRSRRREKKPYIKIMLPTAETKKITRMVSGLLASFFSYVMLWCEALFLPSKTFERELANASFLKAVNHIVLSSTINGLILAVLKIKGLISLPYFLSYFDSFTGFSLLLLIPIAYSILLFFVLFFVSWLLNGVADLLGGEAPMGNLFYLAAVFTSPIIVLMTLFGVVSFAPIGLFQGIVEAVPSIVFVHQIFFSVFWLLLLTIAIAVIYEFDAKRAIGVWLAPAIALFLLFSWSGLSNFYFKMPVLVITKVEGFNSFHVFDYSFEKNVLKLDLGNRAASDIVITKIVVSGETALAEPKTISLKLGERRLIELRLFKNCGDPGDPYSKTIVIVFTGRSGLVKTDQGVVRGMCS